MLPTFLLSALAIASSVQAAPFFGSSSSNIVVQLEKRAEEAKQPREIVKEIQIHESCSPAQTRYLRNGLNEMNTLAEHAFNRILEQGEDDELYRKYFGNASSASAAGFYASVVWGNKAGTPEGGPVLLRCDNPDGNCNETTAAGPWAGHWRGKNGTEQTVICPPTYTNRTHLDTLCWDGLEVGVAPQVQWLGVDLLHRMTHIPTVAYHHIQHAAEEYGEVLEIAAANNSLTVVNSETLQYYALDAYAQDVAYPPNGCNGYVATEEHDHDHSATSSVASSTAVATATAVGAATTTASAAANCHTHLGGEVHCE